MALVEWRLYDVAGERYDDDLVDGQITDAYNRYARSATALLEDPDGEKPLEYPRPSPVELEIKRDVDDEWLTRFGGFVVNPKTSRSTTELELLSHDFWLRKRPVYRLVDGLTISETLELLIGDTPLEYDPALVDVFDDRELEGYEWRGQSLDDVLDELAAISGGEQYGATDDMRFYFRQPDTRRAPRDFVEGEYFETRFDEDGKHEVNEVTLNYGGDPADRAVIREDAEAQLALQEQIGASSPVVIGTTKTYTTISSESRAIEKADEILEGLEAVQTGELETWEAYDVRAGDVTRVVDPEKGIDAEYRVAEISYTWRGDSTHVRLAENTEGVTDTLVSMSREIDRIDSRAADPDATILRTLALSLPIEVEYELEMYSRTVPDDALIWGPAHGGFGDPRVDGGLFGDQRGAREQML